MNNQRISRGAGVLLCAALAGAEAHGAPRDVQIRSVNFATGVVELHNFGAAPETLTGWRFCTHDENQIFRYSAPGGLNSVTVPAGGSFFVHFNNDATQANEINISTIGGFFALPLDGAATGDAYGMGLYTGSFFASGSTIADHLQWSRDGLDNLSADERSDEAQSGLVWNDQSQWIATGADTTYIRLRNPTAGGAAGSPNVNSPADYDALAARPDCQPNGQDDLFDIQDGTSADANTNDIPDECESPATCDGDADANGTVDSSDLSFVIFRLGDAPPACTGGDVNNTGSVEVDDITYVIFRLGTCDPDPCTGA